MFRRLFWLVVWVVCGLGAVIAWVRMLPSVLVDDRRKRIIGVGFDITFNGAIGGKEGQLLSKRAAQGRDLGMKRWCLMCKFLDWLDPGHCDAALKWTPEE